MSKKAGQRSWLDWLSFMPGQDYRRALLLVVPIILTFTFFAWIEYRVDEGDLHRVPFGTALHRPLARFSGFVTDLKFAFRGSQKPKNKITIVAIDESAIEAIGRWPWHRDMIAAVIDKAYEAGAKTVGLDIVFAEGDMRVPPELRAILRQNKLEKHSEALETDPVLARTIAQRTDSLVLGWTTDTTCIPTQSKVEECPVTNPQALETHPQGYSKFALPLPASGPVLDPSHTPIASLVTFIPNMASFNRVATHAGYFNAWPDPDGFVRRTSLVMMGNGRAYPALALEMARVGLQENLSYSLDPQNRLKELRFAKSGRTLPVNATGVFEINFRGPGYSFPYVSAVDLLSFDKTKTKEFRVGASGEKKASVDELFKDAYVVVGVSALGAYDMRAFPFDSATPGVEGHATILDNILSNDALNGEHRDALYAGLLLSLTLGALILLLAVGGLGSIPAMIFFVGLLTCLFVVDAGWLFARGFNANTGLLYAELSILFAATQTVKYISEERQKKFVRAAFGKYVSPKVVDSLLRDPSGLKLGSERKELTVLFTDIRNFTGFSEVINPKALSSFLNEYFSLMTGVVVNDFSGTLDKYIGDAIMAFWGAPLAEPRHAENACRAAVVMQELLTRHRDELLNKYGMDVRTGIGIHTGMMSVGNMGSEQNFAYTVIGDNVNLASRLEGLTKTYGVDILTTRRTLDLIQANGSPIPLHRVLDHVKVKGRREAVEIVEVLVHPLDPSGVERFEEARRLYRAAHWIEARDAFLAASELLSKVTGDPPSRLLAERCQQCLENPPAPDWDGSWEMKEK